MARIKPWILQFWKDNYISSEQNNTLQQSTYHHPSTCWLKRAYFIHKGQLISKKTEFKRQLFCDRSLTVIHLTCWIIQPRKKERDRKEGGKEGGTKEGRERKPLNYIVQVIPSRSPVRAGHLYHQWSITKVLILITLWNNEL